jgi:hypothetical protein
MGVDEGSQPWIEDRAAQPYLARRMVVTIDTASADVQTVAAELFRWLKRRGIATAGPPFIRYLAADFVGGLDIEVGIPVARPVRGERPVIAGTLPAGRYLVQRHTGLLVDLLGADMMLGRWADQHGAPWNRDRIDRRAIWRGRVERFLLHTATESDPSTWDVEVAYLLGTNVGGNGDPLGASS